MQPWTESKGMSAFYTNSSHSMSLYLTMSVEISIFAIPFTTDDVVTALGWLSSNDYVHYIKSYYDRSCVLSHIMTDHMHSAH